MSIKFYENNKVSKELYVGAVIATRERNFYDDSDFYAIIWNEEKQRLEHCEYDTTRFAGGGTATVDCTPANLAKAYAWAYRETRKRVWAAWIDSLKTPCKGDMVRVTAGKKVSIGTMGKLFFIGEKRTFGHTDTQAVGLALSEEKRADGRYKEVIWTYLHNIEALPAYKFSFGEARRLLQRLKKHSIHYWNSMGSTLPCL